MFLGFSRFWVGKGFVYFIGVCFIVLCYCSGVGISGSGYVFIFVCFWVVLWVSFGFGCLLFVGFWGFCIVFDYYVFLFKVGAMRFLRFWMIGWYEMFMSFFSWRFCIV